MRFLFLFKLAKQLLKFLKEINPKAFLDSFDLAVLKKKVFV